MISEESKIVHMISDIRESMRESPCMLYRRLVTERLDKSLKSYCKDLNDIFISVGDKCSRLDKDLKGLFKRGYDNK